jgi:hypothetical protein
MQQIYAAKKGNRFNVLILLRISSWLHVGRIEPTATDHHDRRVSTLSGR